MRIFFQHSWATPPPLTCQGFGVSLRQSLSLLAAVAVVALHADTPDRLGPVATLWVENDAVFNTDRHYTHGSRIGYLAAEKSPVEGDAVSSLASAIPHLGLHLEAVRWGAQVGQSLYTPTDLHQTGPQVEDRPYAAWLYAAAVLQRRGTDFGSIPTLDHFSCDLGLIGPGALGEELQDVVHRVDAAGWSHQLQNEPAINLNAERFWKLQMAGHEGWSTEWIPFVGARAGTLQVQGNLGAQVRTGWNLPSDFGRHPLDDAASETGGAQSGRPRHFHIYLLAGAEAKIVGWNMLLDGNLWHESPSVDKKNLVADFTAGLVAGWGPLELGYIHVFRSQEFENQSEVDSFGSVAISCRW